LVRKIFCIKREGVIPFWKFWPSNPDIDENILHNRILMKRGEFNPNLLRKRKFIRLEYHGVLKRIKSYFRS
jgi:hypothetical protein